MTRAHKYFKKTLSNIFKEQTGFLMFVDTGKIISNDICEYCAVSAQVALQCIFRRK